MNRYYLLLIPLLLLGGCAAGPAQPPAASAPGATQAQTGEPSTQAPGLRQFGEEPIPIPETGPVKSSNRAVIALLNRAQLDSASGKREAAGVSLERALRIEPRNRWLWHELAKLRLAQGQYAQAITLARKSTSFGGHDRRLQVENWRLIGDARVAQGDSSGAEQAFNKAQELEQPEAIPGL